MIYFLLPSSPKYTFKHISIVTSKEEPRDAVSQSLCKYMNEIKEKIALREKEWDVYKKYTNTYEYIHSIVPHKKKSVSKYKPISRSYFKMIEMMNTFNLCSSADTSSEWSTCINLTTDTARNAHITGSNSEWHTQKDDTRAKKHFSQKALSFDSLLHMRLPGMYTAARPCAIAGSTDRSSHNLDKIKTFHLAEGPGGFIEAVCNRRSNINDEYYGMTILVDATDDNVPGWNKSRHFLEQHPNIRIEVGSDGTGNILHVDNFDYCVSKYASSMDLITADGGFDFSKNFNKQEISIAHLLWAQVCYALCLQKPGGNFVLKIFDIFYEHTIDILYILSGFYSEVNVCKLKTSRIGNSEKYVICKGFRFANSDKFAHIIRDSFLNLSRVHKLPELINTWQRASRDHYFAPLRSLHMNSRSKDNLLSPIPLFGNCDYPADTSPQDEVDTQHHILRLLNVEIPRHFTKQIEDVNAIFGQQQIENIHYTISIIDKHPKYDKTEQLTQQNIAKCVHWCIENQVPYNTITSSNLFLGSDNATAET